MASSSSPGQPKSKKLRKSYDDSEIVLPATAPSPQPVRLSESLELNPPLAESTTERNSSPYDIFISHYGKDTKHTLATTIYERLQASRKSVFLDQRELQLGDYFPLNIKNAIDTASFHIVIFSKNFAKSPWCLEELRLMLQTSIAFIPIFYHVEPYDVRWAIEGKGNYAAHISELEKKEDNNKKRYNNDQLERWKLALHRASFYNGAIINDQLDEEKALMNVENRVLKVTLDAGKHAVRLDELEQEFDEKRAHQSKPIQIVGISGVGGIGKTTLARHIYNKKCSSFTKSSFLFNIPEAERNDLMYEKQKELLKDLELDTEREDVENIDYGKISQLKQFKVLIVLDNVHHKNQLDALLPEKKNFGQGSLIIVTTCKDQVLVEWDVSCIYPIPKLTGHHAHQLFCWHAFGHPSPSVKLEALVQNFTNACNGLPLSLVVLGSQLYALSESDWKLFEISLGDISNILPNDILNISYNALKDNEKKMFLDIACFFDGWPRSEAIATWDNSECNGLHNLQKLVNKCFIETYEKDHVTRIRMSDHSREFGREIANKQSSLRLWSKNQIITIQHEEAMQIRGMADAFGENCFLQDGQIILRTSQGQRNLAPRSLGLEIFIGKGDFINKECSEISRKLVFFCCDRFLHKNLPSWLPLECLRILQLSKPQNLKVLWEQNAPSQLKQLRISNGYELESISALESLTSLEKLTISGCTELKTFPSLAGPTSLKEINLIRCNKLEKIECLRSLTSLETIIIHYCTELTTLPILGEATSLKKFDLRGCNKLKKIESFGNLRSLETVVIHDCSELQTFPSLTQAKSLKTFDARYCPKFKMNERFDKRPETLIMIGCAEIHPNICPSKI